MYFTAILPCGTALSIKLVVRTPVPPATKICAVGCQQSIADLTSDFGNQSASRRASGVTAIGLYDVREPRQASRDRGRRCAGDRRADRGLVPRSWSRPPNSTVADRARSGRSGLSLIAVIDQRLSFQTDKLGRASPLDAAFCSATSQPWITSTCKCP